MCELTTNYFSIPYLIRIKQCLTEIKKSEIKQHKRNHLLNILKYIALLGSSITVAFSKNSQTYRLIGVYFSIIAIIFASYWDIIMDWGLDRIHMRKYLGNTTYMVCFFNLVFRFLNSFPQESNVFDKISNPHLLNSLEIVRRSIWTEIRIQNYFAQQDIQ